MNLNFVKSIYHSDVCHFGAQVQVNASKSKRRKLIQLFLKKMLEKNI